MRQTAILVVVLAFTAPAAAQELAPTGVSLGVETTRDRWHYRFENPSSFSTPELVPHEFTQTYWGDNLWLVVQGRYGPSGRFTSEVAAALPKERRGDDYDTFFQPSGDTVIVGTTGDVSMRSWRAKQMIGLGNRAGVDWSVGYQYRRDRSVFGPGLKTTTHTQPASLESETIYTRETTVSQVYGVALGAEKSWRGNGVTPWTLTLGISEAPILRARLLTQLPDKYPGVDIVFAALANQVQPMLRLTLGNRVPVSVVTTAAKTFRYQKSSEFVQNYISVAVGVGWKAR